MRVAMLLALVVACGDDTTTTTKRGCVASVGARGTTCAVRSDGSVFCWGASSTGAIGNGVFSDAIEPPTRALIDHVQALASGEFTMCAIREDRTMACWGDGSEGLIGDGGGSDRATPTTVPLVENVVEAGAAQSHACARMSDGTARCWGSNAANNISASATTVALTPELVPALGNATSFTVGDFVTCAIYGASLQCWGTNNWGELGDGTSSTPRGTPAPVIAIADPVTRVVAGCHHHLCALTSVGEVWCWGVNEYGELGRGTTTSFEATPARVQGLPAAAIDIAVGASHSCALTDTHEVWCWGANHFGELGDGTFDHRSTAVQVQSIDRPIVQLEGACASTFALRDDGILLGWGAFSTLGTGETLNRAVPDEVPIPCDDLP